MTPVWWNRFLALFATSQSPVERPHKDGIEITRDSPDAFEEPIWQHYFPHIHDATRSHVLDASVEKLPFAQFYTEHIKKILLIREGHRYVSKGNYNLTRIQFIKRLFPTARFLLPIRHPISQITSLARQHELFVKYAENDSAVCDYLKAVGHYEFGPQRLPVCITAADGREILSEWERGDNFMGYAIQWASIYRHVLDLMSTSSAIRDSMLIVRYEDLCRSPFDEFDKILNFCELSKTDISEILTRHSPALSNTRLPDGVMIENSWSRVAPVAQEYGYGRNSDG